MPPQPPELPAPIARGDPNVQFTVYRPKIVEPDRWYPLLAFAHLEELPADAPPGTPDPLAEVRRQAEQLLGHQAAGYNHSTEDSRAAVPHAGEITLVPSVRGVEFNPPRRSFRWLKPVHREEFDLRAAPELNGQTAKGTLTVLLGPILLAEITLSLPVRRGAGA